MKTNTQPEHCSICGNPIPTHGGVSDNRGGYVHLICRANRAASVSLTVFADGAQAIENSAGRCEDAPCCGCCGPIT